MRSIYRAQCDCKVFNKAIPEIINHTMRFEEHPIHETKNGPYEIEFYMKCRQCSTPYSEERIDDEKENPAT